jgi:hypothetical protein
VGKLIFTIKKMRTIRPATPNVYIEARAFFLASKVSDMYAAELIIKFTFYEGETSFGLIHRCY